MAVSNDLEAPANCGLGQAKVPTDQHHETTFKLTLYRPICLLISFGASARLCFLLSCYQDTDRT
jgi:hypothetical protein